MFLGTTSSVYGQLVNDLSTLTTSGTAEIEVPADEAKVSLSIVTENKDSTVALSENNTLVAEVIQSLKDIGLGKDEYQSGNFQVLPQYADNKFGITEQIIGYSVTNNINITTRRIELLGRIISDSNKAGANHVNSISFGLADPRTKRNFVIEQATKNAIEDAKFLAKAASVSLEKILSLSVDNASNNIVQPRNTFHGQEGFSSLKKVSLPPIEPGNTTIRSTVTVTYQVGPTSN